MTAPEEQEKRDRIVVGVYGTPLGAKALRWAVDYARRTNAEIDAVMAWHMPARSVINHASTEEDEQERYQQALDHAVHEAVGDVVDVPIHRHVVQHRAAPALVAAAHGAQLLVVAARGERVIPGVQLGSVARFCADHAPCPVLVFREEGPPRAGIGH